MAACTPAQGIKKRRWLDRIAFGAVELGIKPDDYGTQSAGIVRAMERAWVRRERRESERFAVVAYCAAAAAGSKVTLEEIRAMMPAYQGIEEEDGQ